MYACSYESVRLFMVFMIPCDIEYIYTVAIESAVVTFVSEGRLFQGYIYETLRPLRGMCLCQL
jgi:hypothetical protein